MTEPSRADDLREELGAFGLSDTEIDAYLTILSTGETTTREVSEESDVTQRAVYSIAERLENRGLVRVNDHASPTTIRAVPPDEAIATLSKRLESIRPVLEARYTETAPKAPEIQIVKSRETVLKRFRNAIADADHEIVVAIPHDVYPEIESELRAAHEDGTLVFLLVGELDDAEASQRTFADAADVVRQWGADLPFLYAVDDEVSMIGDSGLPRGTHEAGENAVFVSESNLAGAVFGLYLGTYWPASTERYVTDPDPLPNHYDWFRTAVLHAFLHDRNGRELWADVETVDGERVSGRVSRIRQPFVEPATSEFALENSLFLETEEGEVSIGGSGTFLEDYEGIAVTLRSA
ncbi:TrmB family transcriptional regulator [Saliphagus infecundisoli]|uniref:TrmB family transcriptional regulator n=1 Tax=Saliphagus infecundisoli TaxID=1849069 RepID=A0ABD5QHU4_9EURY|nr:TrmB family transcriptional regulator [Saliphagus infecundisoli]